MTDLNSSENMTPNQQIVKVKKVSWIKHTLVSISILIITFFIISGMFASKPEARKSNNRPPPSVSVETTKLSAVNYEIWIESYGSATPLTETTLVAEVSGKVIEVADNIRAGSSFKKGDILLKIDSQDYQIEVDIASAAIAEAEVNYEQELAQADIAKRDWNVRPKNARGKSLALREPQIKAAIASLKSANAKFNKAKLNLQRTNVRVPFDGKVMRQIADVGYMVNSSQAIAEIYSTELIEVRLPVKFQDLANLHLPDESQSEYKPRVILESDIGNKTYQWQANLVRSEGAFDKDTRMLYVVAQLQNPFQATATSPAMRVGQFLRAKIEGIELSNVYVIPRRAVTQDNMIAIAEEGMLIKRKIEPIWTDKDYVVISASNELDGLSKKSKATINSNDTIILTPTASLASGTRVKFINDTASPLSKSTVAKQDDARLDNKGGQ